MLLRRRRPVEPEAAPAETEVLTEPGASLAKGPALIAGAVLVAFGLCGLLKNNDFPSFSASFPNGEVQGSGFLGIEVNGWTAFFSITAGALLLFGAAQHHLAKMMSLIVGLALAACAVIAVIDGSDVLGLAAANTWTKLGFAVAGAVCLLNALMPRRTRVIERDRDRAVAPAAATGRFGRPDPVADDEPATRPVPTRRAVPTDDDEVDAEAPTTVGRRDAALDAANAPTTADRAVAPTEADPDTDPTEPAPRRGRFGRRATPHHRV
jgi:hypothetical protein